MKFYATLVAVFFTVSCAQAQIIFGIRAGLNSTIFSSKNDGKKSEISEYLKYKQGFQIGVVGENSFTEKFASQIGILYTTQGWKFDFGDITKSTINLNYLQIHVKPMYKYDIGMMKLFFHISPYFSYALNGKVKGETTIDGNTEKHDRKMIFGSKNGEMKIWDWGIYFGLGFQLDNIQVGFAHNRGLANLSNVKNASEKINGFALTATYLFSK